ncbi:uncharacterized protein LOC132175423 isoform X2 [Corylus avellana]|uniref:uncharacterized protein LOC132175423 isoform X2 n=1 Tax=Corylus avellana TaxID=13451 RepID=UPI00286B546B|nr:uncharacterized protein LOC132175423 isoform X2 [Corylus avellana]
METRLADSDLSLTTTTNTAVAAAANSEKAWHLLALLLSLGRTARPAELASRCALFRVSPDFIEFLCSVPGSLLLLTGDFHVTLSPLALTALAEFVSNSNLRSAFTPQIGNRLWNDIDFLKVYSRKRKPSTSLIPELAPVPKRIANCDSGAEEERKSWLCLRKPIQNVCPKVQFYVTDDVSRSINMQPSDMSVMVEGDIRTSIFLQRKVNKRIMACEPDSGPALPNTIVDHLVVSKDAKINEREFGSTMNINATCCLEDAKYRKTVCTPKEKRPCRRDQTSISMAQKLQRNHDNRHIKEKRGSSTSVFPKDQQETKLLPNFELYNVEEEEGSGGYGTVYRARRKSDGITVAIKCPHANAHKHHVINELKMLERFGGKDFIIKYEGCFKNGNSDCFVLEHVEHDRPEVLKKEINVFQLQWYGYCMFRALASLHKQGIVHRDVKPGNFLFSRKANKGYLIDFNLAMDLHQKYGNTSKSRMGYDRMSHVMVPNSKSISSTTKTSHAVYRETPKGSKSNLDPKNLKRKALGQAKVCKDLVSLNVIKSQGADGSGITSAKDVTSTRTPSTERRREPIPRQGRKELISLLQEAMRSPNYKAPSVPAPMRKRVAASPRQVDSNLFYITPMPLHSTVIDVAGAGSIKKKGDGKQKREGPCVGTKGFRAPEVLFRSPHQGPKVDIWSAGVTLLYLMIGRTSFLGDPEQNIKDIAKMRGSEDLWEVAKLHNRESSFPLDLYDTQYFPSIKLQDWCETNTKRPEFLEVIPRSLFDLVDKCLTVNPRLRISAEEALNHEFFAPCHESPRKERLKCGTSHSLHGQCSAKPVQISGGQC